MNILDAGNQPLTYMAMQQAESTDSQVIVIRAPCLAGQFLTADDVTEARVLVRESGVGSYQDISTTPIDLSPYDGLTQDFELKVHTTSVDGIVPVAVEVRVTYNP